MNKRTLVNSGLIGAMLASIIFIEGDYSNDPYDPGGETKYGITERVAREYGYTGEMADLTKEEATKIYTTLYVEQPNFNLLVDINPAIAHKLIDAGVNVGTTRVSLWFQKALNNFSRDGQDYPRLREDGIIGPSTINAYRFLENKRGKETACSLVLKALDSYQANYYMNLHNYSRYVVGQVDKRVQNIPLDQCKEYNLVLPLEPEMNNESQ